MGWSSGTNIAEAIEKIILTHVPKDQWLQAAEIALTALEEQDWDCQDEVELFDYADYIRTFRSKEFKKMKTAQQKEIVDALEKYKEKFGDPLRQEEHPEQSYAEQVLELQKSTEEKTVFVSYVCKKDNGDYGYGNTAITYKDFVFPLRKIENDIATMYGLNGVCILNIVEL